jgi:hypothetical protein
MNPDPLPVDLDRAVLDTLKEVHNRGAELYNAGEHAAAYRLYQGGLIVAKPFLAYRPKQQSAVQEGLDQIDQSQADPKLKAFRLHEVIDQIRAELKSERKGTFSHLPPAEAAVSGVVNVGGTPMAGVAIAFIPAKTTKSLATVKSSNDGRFQLTTTMPIGAYLVTLVGKGIPEHYTQPDTTPIKADLKAGINSLMFDAN